MLALVAMLLVADPAPVTIELHYMPPGKKVYLPPPDNTWGRGFNFEEYKLLLKMDGDLWDAGQKIEVYQMLVTTTQEESSQKDKVIRSLKSDLEIAKEREGRATTNWHAAEEKLIEASGGPLWPYILAACGAVVGIVGATAAIVMKIEQDAHP